MKIIIIKTYKNLKVNEIVDASDGYAKNFLIKKGYAVSYNPTNEKELKKEFEKNRLLELQKKLKDSEKLKKIIEKCNIIIQFKSFKRKYNRLNIK